MTWEVFDTFYGAHWLATGYSCRGFVQNFPRLGGGDFITEFVGVMDRSNNSVMFRTDEFEQAASYTADRLINDAEWRTARTTEFYAVAKQLFALGEELRFTDLKKETADQLAQRLEPLLAIHQEVRLLGVLLNGVIIDGRGHLSEQIQTELRQSIPADRFGEVWSILSQPTKPSFAQQRTQALIELARQLEGHEDATRLRTIHDRYCWLPYMYQGSPTSIDDLSHELSVVRRAPPKTTPESELITRSKIQQELMNELSFDERSRFLVALAQDVIWQKGYRKDVEYHAFWCYEPLMRELARRHGTADWQAFFFLLPWEMVEFLKTGRPNLAELAERRDYSCLVVDQTTTQLLVGPEAREHVNRLGLAGDQPTTETKVKGQCAVAGRVEGTVRLVFVPADMAKVSDGDILVSQATSPDLLPAMKKAAAIVTNVGGLICHAAITARELGIPCVVGTVRATKVFQDGDRVLVNATNGVVEKISS